MIDCMHLSLISVLFAKLLKLVVTLVRKCKFKYFAVNKQNKRCHKCQCKKNLGGGETVKLEAIGMSKRNCLKPRETTVIFFKFLLKALHKIF